MSQASGSARFARTMDHIAPALEQVEQAMHDQLVSQSPVIASMGQHLLAAGGKRVRPGLVLLAAELCGYTGPRRIQIAAAIEFLHTASLIHDDVVDGSDLRRGRPAAHSLWGNRRAVLVGDFVLARSSAMSVEDGDLDVLWLFADTIRRMSEGELLQLDYCFDVDVTEAHYYDVIERKSAVLFSAACEAGAILARVTRSERRRLAEFGRELGLAFQLRDDALDYEGGEAALGKRRYADLREGKVTLPLLLTLKRCTPAERAQITAVLKDAAAQAPSHEDGAAEPAPIDFEPVARCVDRYRGAIDTVRRAEEHVARAAAVIAPFPDGPAREALLAAAEFSVARGA